MSKLKIDNIKKCIDYFSDTNFTKEAIIELRELVKLANIGRRLLDSIDKNYYWVMSESNDNLNRINKNDIDRLMDWEYEDGH